MRVFVAVAEAQSLSGAGRRLGMSAPVVTRVIASLEEALGVTLLHRTTRLVRLTEAGQQYLADCVGILSAVEAAEAAASSSLQSPRGQLSLTAPVLFGRMFVAPVLLEFLSLYPEVSVRTLLLDRVIDLVEEGVDVAVRIAHLPDSSLRAVRVGAVRRVVCASPGYLEEHGTPTHPRELGQHETVLFTSSVGVREWSFSKDGQTETMRPRARLLVNSAELAIQAALAGHGLTRVLSYQVSQHLTSGALRVVLSDFEDPPVPIQVVHYEGRRVTARVKAFVDLAVERLRAAML